jgi:hypothetical protein
LSARQSQIIVALHKGAFSFGNERTMLRS